jgi:hypothetical protein
MDYRNKYLKYKQKYINLKNVFGGSIKYNDKDIKYETLTILNYDSKTNIFSAQRDPLVKDEQINLTQENNVYENRFCKYELIPYSESNFDEISHLGSELMLIDIPTSSEFIIRITNLENKNYIEIVGNYKIFIINFTKDDFNYKLIIRSELGNLSDNFYIHKDGYYSGFKLEIQNDTTKFIINGKLKIIKHQDGRTNKIYFNIDRINNTKCTIREFSDITKFYVTKFNFQEAYDRLKQTNNKCPESTILFKHIYNTFYTEKLIENYNLWSLIHEKLGQLLELSLETNIINNEANIIDICSNTDKRQQLLTNTMKRIETSHTNGFLIKNNEDTFIPINSLGDTYRIVFDTGNSAICMININFVRALNLRPIKTFKVSTMGTTGDTIENNEYVIIEIKLDPTKFNIDIGKTFKFKAYVQHRGLQNTLLLGQSAYSLKQFFDESYCIGFDTTRIEYERKIRDIKSNLLSYCDMYTDILQEMNILFATKNIVKFIYSITTIYLRDVIVPLEAIVTDVYEESDINIVDELYKKGNLIKVEYDKINKLIQDKTIQTSPDLIFVMEKIENSIIKIL